jgi:hypothetical protein
MADNEDKFYKIIDKKKPSGWSAGYGTDVDVDNVITEAFVQEGKLKEAVWYLIQFQLAILDYHDTGDTEDMRKAKLYGEHLLGRLLK